MFRGRHLQRFRLKLHLGLPHSEERPGVGAEVEPMEASQEGLPALQGDLSSQTHALRPGLVLVGVVEGLDEEVKDALPVLVLLRFLRRICLGTLNVVVR